MPQTLKNEVRERIVRGAETVFAERGYRSASVAQIAAAAGLSTGNVYRYFAGKRALFESVVDPEFVREFDRRLDRRVGELANTDLINLGPEARAADLAMLRFWFEHRLRVVVLLDRADGSPYEGFGERFVARLVELATGQLERQTGAPLPDAARLMLEPIFQTSRRSVVAILQTYETERELFTAFEAFRSFQLAGLAGFQRWVTQQGDRDE